MLHMRMCYDQIMFKLRGQGTMNDDVNLFYGFLFQNFSTLSHHSEFSFILLFQNRRRKTIPICEIFSIPNIFSCSAKPTFSSLFSPPKLNSIASLLDLLNPTFLILKPLERGLYDLIPYWYITVSILKSCLFNLRLPLYQIKIIEKTCSLWHTFSVKLPFYSQTNTSAIFTTIPFYCNYLQVYYLY